MAIKPRAVALLAALLLAAGWARGAAALEVIAEQNSVYHTIYITAEDGLRCMRFSLVLPGRQSCVDPAQPRRLIFDYTQAMMGVLFVQPAPKRILMIGLGGGSLPMALRQLYPEAQIDSVEIDPAVAALAEKHFFFAPDGRLSVTVGDGRLFVKRAAGKEPYDIVLLDAYNKNYIPEHLLTVEFLREVKAVLAPGGVLAANTASSGALYAYESATYAAVFGDFFNLKPKGRVIIAARDGLPGHAALEKNAQALAARLEPLGVKAARLLGLFNRGRDWPERTPVLTDNYNPANLLNKRP